jgi:hypothetical protein
MGRAAEFASNTTRLLFERLAPVLDRFVVAFNLRHQPLQRAGLPKALCARVPPFPRLRAGEALTRAHQTFAGPLKGSKLRGFWRTERDHQRACAVRDGLHV